MWDGACRSLVLRVRGWKSSNLLEGGRSFSGAVLAATKDVACTNARVDCVLNVAGEERGDGSLCRPSGSIHSSEVTIALPPSY